MIIIFCFYLHFTHCPNFSGNGDTKVKFCDNLHFYAIKSLTTVKAPGSAWTLSDINQLLHFAASFLATGQQQCFVFLSFCRCDSIEKLKAQLPKIEQELKDSRKFKDFYQFTFNFAKNPGQKGLGKNPFNAHWLFLFSWLNFF